MEGPIGRRSLTLPFSISQRNTENAQSPEMLRGRHSVSLGARLAQNLAVGEGTGGLFGLRKFGAGVVRRGKRSELTPFFNPTASESRRGGACPPLGGGGLAGSESGGGVGAVLSLKRDFSFVSKWG